MESWIQFAGLFFGMIGTIGGLGFFFLRSFERLDRNYEAIQQELKIMHGKVSVLEDKKK